MDRHVRLDLGPAADGRFAIPDQLLRIQLSWTGPVAKLYLAGRVFGSRTDAHSIVRCFRDVSFAASSSDPTTSVRP